MDTGLYKLTLARFDFFPSEKACAYMVKQVSAFDYLLHHHLYAFVRETFRELHYRCPCKSMVEVRGHVDDRF